jgi:transcriptional regulator with XRE-family HTH domain
MNKRTLGQAIKQKRLELALTQRELANQLGVKASHVAYIESGRRKPSLTLIRRIADALGLDRQEIFLLSHPEAKYLVNQSRESVARNGAWREFVASHSLLKRYRVTRGELKILKQVSLLRRVSHPRHFLFVLNSIRQATE